MEVIFNDVSFKYKDSNNVLSSINMKFKAGLITSIVGNGKTTITKILDRKITINNGQIMIGKIDLNDDKAKYMLSVANNDISSFSQKTVYEELIYQLQLFNSKKDNVDEHISKALLMVGLDDYYLHRTIKTLSISELCLLGLAKAIITNPKILVVDSIFGYLDVDKRNKIIKLFHVMKRRYNKIIVLLDNKIDIIHKLSDYIYILNRGKIVLEGTKYEVFSDNKTLKKYSVVAPKIINFENMVKDKKGIRLGYRDDINDLLKDIYRNV